ncbi:hypothetical protein BGZ46_008560 [Entomortierella lignicola]|nr:hypothetical protein BGZ46_008560 [Entomortierella lignicola]
MQPSTVIPASHTAPSAPRAQRPNNRKSGITTALQKQSQTQSRNNNNSNNNSCNNGPRHVQRSPDQVHSRHQSMPPQQRGNKNDMTNVTILKRSSATPAPKGSAQLQAPQQQQQQLQNFHQQQYHHHNHHRNNYQKPNPQVSSKTRRVQKRREIDSQAQADLDLALQQSPPLDPSSPPSSSDSDDSESTLSRLPDNVLNARRQRQLSTSSLQRPSSAPSQMQTRQGYQNLENQRYNPNVTKANSTDKVLLVEKKSTLYAGPTFHNAPPPTSLPIPAFARPSPVNSPTEPSAERLPSTPFFAEAASPQLNSMRPQMAQVQPTNWTGHYSMPMPMPMAHHYNVPDRMATSSFTPHAPGQYGVDQLMEISQNLRTLLKIQSQ